MRHPALSGTPCDKYLELVADNPNPSMSAAWIEQESSCNPFAESPYAVGLAQIAFSNLEWLENGLCRDLGKARPKNARWSESCGQRLKASYRNKVRSKHPNFNYCRSETITLLVYNGGHWVLWEIDDAGTLTKAKALCGSRKLSNGRGPRKEWACKQNYGYAPSIFKRQPKYKSLGGKLCL